MLLNPYRFVLAAPPLWTPADLPAGPAIWFNDTSEVTEVSSAISSVIENSSNGFVFSQNVISNRPIIAANVLAGKRVYRFDGVNDGLFGPNTAAAQSLLRGVEEAWMITVYRSSTSNSSNRYYFNISHSTGNNARLLGVASSITGGTFINRPGVGARAISTDGYSEARSSVEVGADWLIAMKRVSFASKTARVTVNGGPDEEYPMANMTVSPSQDVAHRTPDFGTNTASPFGGDIAEFVFGTGALSAADIDKLFGSLHHKWGMADKLPAGHPYKMSPPVA